MSSLIRSYGGVLAALFGGLTLLWIIGLIVLPQLNMIQRAFIWEARDGAAQQAGVDLERAYQKIATLDYDIRAAKRDIERGSAPSAAPSPSDPFAVSPGAPSPGGLASSETPDKRIVRLESERTELQGQINPLKERFGRLKIEEAEASGYSIKNFTTMSPLHWRIFGMTIFYAFCVTLLSFLFCYPIAYTIARTQKEIHVAFFMLGIIIPYALNELLRIFAWTMILANEGILNSALDTLGLIDLESGEAIRWLASNGAVFCVLMYTYILFMIFPMYNTIETLDKNQIEAARDLGASTWRIHSRVVIPHAKPGIAVGAIMTFMLSAGSISVPGLVGPGLHPDWFSQIIYRNFFEAGNWNIGAAQSLLLLVACTIFILIVLRFFRVGIQEIAR
ncbi:MAG: ABC transporter permease [Hyphomicrobiales bacterium]|nr:ABC transporter permease [Hyphomicrobiales bacterium]